MSRGRPDDPLAALAQDYYRGLLTRESYRRQRSAVLDRLVSGGDDCTAASAPRRPVGRDPYRPMQSPGGAQDQRRLTGNSGSRLVAVSVTAALVALTGLAWLVVFGRDAPEKRDVAVNAGTAQTDPAGLAAFLERHDWSDGAVADLRDRIAALPALDRRALEASPIYLDLTSAVRSRLAERQAMIDNGPVGDEALASLAVELGLLKATPAIPRPLAPP